MITLKLTAHCSGDDCGETEELDVPVSMLPFNVKYTEDIGIAEIYGIDDQRLALPEGWDWLSKYGDSWDHHNARLFCPACTPAKRQAQKAARAARKKRYETEQRSRRRKRR